MFFSSASEGEGEIWRRWEVGHMKGSWSYGVQSCDEGRGEMVSVFVVWKGVHPTLVGRNLAMREGRWKMSFYYDVLKELRVADRCVVM